jgi:hypothetical protein
MTISKDGNPHDAGTPDAAPVETAPKKGRSRRKAAAKTAAKAEAPKKKRRRNHSPKEDRQLKERREKMALALNARSNGYKYREIAAELQVDVATAYKYVQDGLAELPREAAEELRAIELDRIDTMLTKLMEVFLETPDPIYSDQILKLMGARAKYTGILDQPKEPGEGGGRNYDGGGRQSFADSLKGDVPQLQLPAPIVLKPDEAVPANPIL